MTTAAVVTWEQVIGLSVLLLTILAIRIGVGKLITRFEREGTVAPSTADELRNLVNLVLTAVLIISVISIFLASASQYIAYGLLIFFAIALFAMKDAIANYISYYVIIFSRVVSSRDIVYLRDNDVRGKVTRITPLYTEIRTDEGHVVRIPNAVLLKTTVLIYRGLYRVSVMLRIRSKSSIDVKDIEDKIKTFLERYSEIDRSKPPEIVLADLSENECHIRITVYVANPERTSKVAMDLAERLKQKLAPLEVTAYTI